MTVVHLQLLGPFSLRSGERGLNAGRKHRALLAFAAGGRHVGVSRASIAALLWPDRDDESARNSLRQCIHQIRSMLPRAGALDVQGDLVALCPQHWEIDVWRFEQLASRGSVGDLLAAAALYRGALGEGLEAGPEWDGWLAPERERLRGVAQGLLQRLASSELTAAQCESALVFARRLLADDPLHEGSWRALMMLLDSAGLRAKALGAWEECRRVLDAELGVSPCAETRAVYERLRADDGADPRPPFMAPNLATVPRPLASLRATRSRAQDHILCGMHFLYLGTPADNLRARESFQAATVESPDNADAVVLHGWTHFLDFQYAWNGGVSDSWRTARAKCDDALERFPDHPSPHSLNGKLLLWARQYDAALAEYRLAFALQPTSPYLHSNLADACMRVGHYEEALRLVTRALELEPNDNGVFCTIEGFIRFHRGDPSAALVTFQSAVTRHPVYCVAHSGMAAAYAELGELPQARESAVKARSNNRRYSVDFALDVLPMRDERQRERIAKAWRAAGMPEHEGA